MSQGSSPTIISASRRSDLPAFYPDWILDRFDAGSVAVANPFNRSQTTVVSLIPDHVLAVMFWTKDPSPFLQRWPRWQKFNLPSVWQITITGYGRPLERYVPPASRVIPAVQKLADRVGREAIVWRYDPVILSESHHAAWHRDHFEMLCHRLAPLVGKVMVSVMQWYRKIDRRLVETGSQLGHALPVMPAKPGEKPVKQPEVDLAETAALIADLGKIAQSHGLPLSSCADNRLVGPFVKPGGCVDPDQIRAAMQAQGHGAALEPPVSMAAKPTRTDCGCATSRDIGSYDTCPHGCVYCYAVSSHPKAVAARRSYSAPRPV